jgi:hypothetical protein
VVAEFEMGVCQVPDGQRHDLRIIGKGYLGVIEGGEGVDTFFAVGFGRDINDLVEEFDAFEILFFHDKVDTFEKDLIFINFGMIDIEELGAFEIVAGGVEVFVVDVDFDKVLEAFGGEVFVGVELEALEEVDECLVGVVFLFLDESEYPEEFSAFFTAILLYSFEVWLD